MDDRKIKKLTSEAKALQEELELPTEKMAKAARLTEITKELQHLITKNTSQRCALRQTLVAMGIKPDESEQLKNWYKSFWDKEENDTRFDKDFESFENWFRGYLTDERETPHDIYASHLAMIEDSLPPEWKAYYFHIRTWGTPVQNSCV